MCALLTKHYANKTVCLYIAQPLLYAMPLIYAMLCNALRRREGKRGPNFNRWYKWKMRSSKSVSDKREKVMVPGARHGLLLPVRMRVKTKGTSEFNVLRSKIQEEQVLVVKKTRNRRRVTG